MNTLARGIVALGSLGLTWAFGVWMGGRWAAVEATKAIKVADQLERRTAANLLATFPGEEQIAAERTDRVRLETVGDLPPPSPERSIQAMPASPAPSSGRDGGPSDGFNTAVGAGSGGAGAGPPGAAAGMMGMGGSAGRGLGAGQPGAAAGMMGGGGSDTLFAAGPGATTRLPSPASEDATAAAAPARESRPAAQPEPQPRSEQRPTALPNRPDPMDAAAWHQVLVDPEAPVDQRIKAVRRFTTTSRGEGVDDLIRLSRPEATPDPSLRAAVVDALGELSLLTPAGRRRRPDITQALRMSLKDSSPEIRQRALGALTLLGDEKTIDLLRQVASQPAGSSALIPKCQAVRHLAVDGPKKHYQVLRPLLTDPDPVVCEEAVRALSALPESREQIRAIMSNRQQRQEVRIAAVEGLAANDPDFHKYAQALVAAEQENSAVRIACIGHLGVGAGLGRYPPVGIQNAISAAGHAADAGVRQAAEQATRQIREFTARAD